MLDVAVEPQTAQIFLDGRELGRGKYRATHAAVERDAVLEARAPGYVTDRRVVRLTGDFAATLALSPEAPATDAERVEPNEDTGKPNVEKASAKGVADEASLERRPSTAARVIKRPPAPAESRKAEPAHAVAASCDPPYRLTPDGVQVFKPECF